MTGLLYALDRDREGRRWWIGPWLVLYLLWVNLHGGFLVGAALYGAHCAEQLVRRQPVRHLILVALVMVALIAVNPYGTAYYSYLWKALGTDRSLITEWAPLWTASPPTILVYVISLAVVAYAVRRSGVSRLPGLNIVVLAACAALRHQRHLSLYAVAWLCYVPAFVEHTRLGETLVALWARQRWAMATLWTLVGLAVTTALVLRQPWHLPVPANKGERRVLTPLYPVGAVAYLEQLGFRGNLMTPFTIGAFVTWNLYPAVKISLDGRYEAAYPPDALPEDIAFYGAERGWQDTLAKYPTDAVLIPTNRLVCQAMHQAEGWSRVYRDDVYEIYARSGHALPSVDRRGETFRGTFP